MLPLYTMLPLLWLAPELPYSCKIVLQYFILKLVLPVRMALFTWGWTHNRGIDTCNCLVKGSPNSALHKRSHSSHFTRRRACSNFIFTFSSSLASQKHRPYSTNPQRPPS